MLEVEKIKGEENKIKEELKKRTLGFITAGFGVVAGFAWNEAIKSTIEYLFPLERNTLLAKFIYAVFMTVVLVVITIYLSKIILREKQK